MDEDIKKTVLRMIPYGLYVLTSSESGKRVAAATVNWVTQASFKPPLVVVCVKVDSFIHEVIRQSGVFALNVLHKTQRSLAYAFFKPAEREGMRIGGHKFGFGENHSPILEETPAYMECNLVGSLERGDHSIYVGEVTAVGLRDTPVGRPDDMTLALKDLGDNVFYGG